MDQLVNDIIQTVAEKVLASTIPLFTISEKKPDTPVAHGSAVLINRSGHNILVTAAHCLETKKKERIPNWIFSGDKFHLINRTSYVHSNSAIDVGFVFLEPILVEACNNSYIFLNENYLASLYKQRAGDNYVVAGYPGSRNAVNQKQKKVIIEPFVLHNAAKPISIYTNAGIDPHSFILSSFHRRMSRFSNEMSFHKSPEPYGISGSGLWYIPSFLAKKPKHPSFFLVGIQSEYHPDRSFFKASHISEALRIIDPMILYGGGMINV